MAKRVEHGGLVVLVILACNKPTPPLPRVQEPVVAVSGVVRGPTTQPIAGAEVTLVGDDDRLMRATSDAAGRFRFEVAPGSKWGVAAHHAPYVGGFRPVHAIDRDTALDVALGASGGLTIRGVVRGDVDASTYVRLVENHPERTADVWTASIRPDQTFTAIVPRYAQYTVSAGGNDSIGALVIDGDRATAELTLEITRPRPAPDEVVAWLGATGARLTGTDPALPLEDLAALDGIVGEARIVALGEATHGTREYFQLKHRIIRYLIEKRGFTTFALEANVTECRALDAYIKGGQGDPRRLLAKLYFWVWNSEEVLALVEWLRAWNADPRHAQVSFVGFDMQTKELAFESAARFVKMSAEDTRRSLQTRAAYIEGIATIESRLAAMQDVPREIEDDLEVVRQWLALTGQATGAEEVRLRDRFMADNIAARASRADAGKLIVWAHNMHIESDYEFAMGTHLARRFASSYVTIGFVFDRGTYNASPTGVNLEDARRVVEVGPAPETDIASAFARTGAGLLLVDLRRSSGRVAEYLSGPQLARETGWNVADEKSMSHPRRLAKRFTAALYVAHSTPSQLLDAHLPR